MALVTMLQVHLRLPATILLGIVMAMDLTDTVLVAGMGTITTVLQEMRHLVMLGTTTRLALRPRVCPLLPRVLLESSTTTAAGVTIARRRLGLRRLTKLGPTTLSMTETLGTLVRHTTDLLPLVMAMIAALIVEALLQTVTAPRRQFNVLELPPVRRLLAVVTGTLLLGIMLRCLRQLTIAGLPLLGLVHDMASTSPPLDKIIADTVLHAGGRSLLVLEALLLLAIGTTATTVLRQHSDHQLNVDLTVLLQVMLAMATQQARRWVACLRCLVMLGPWGAATETGTMLLVPLTEAVTQLATLGGPEATLHSLD